MLLDKLAQFADVFVGLDTLQFDHAQVAVDQKLILRIPNVGNASAHSGGEIASCGAEDDHATSGHVFASVVADAFDDGVGAAVADAKPLGSLATEEGFTGRRAGLDESEFFRDELGIRYCTTRSLG